jgi:hypothetical protein
VNAFVDDNANGQRDGNEGYMAGVTISVADSTQVIHQAISAGSADAICFEGLSSGTYQIAQTVPGRLEMTTSANAALAVEAGKTYGVEFGSRVRPADSAAPTSAIAANNPPPQVTAVSVTNNTTTNGAVAGDGPDALAIAGLGILGLAVVMLGVLIFVVLRRQAA